MIKHTGMEGKLGAEVERKRKRVTVGEEDEQKSGRIGLEEGQKRATRGPQEGHKRTPFRTLSTRTLLCHAFR